MSEDRLWKWLRDRLPPGHATRIESEVSQGFPDVHFTMELGPSVTMELKYADGPKKSPLKDHIRTSQKLWIRREVEVGGTVWVVAEIPNQGVLFLEGRYVPILEELPGDELRNRASLVIPKRQRPSSIRESIANLLTREI